VRHCAEASLRNVAPPVRGFEIKVDVLHDIDSGVVDAGRY